MSILSKLLEETSQYHRHLCPRQVLGIRMGLLAGEALGLEVPQPLDGKRLLTIAETDGCAADGLSVATNCWVGRRTLRIEDFGKVAATFVDTKTGQAVRVVPRNTSREDAQAFAPDARNKWEAMLLGYQRMPARDLLSLQPVILKTPIEKIISLPRYKAICEWCSEEIRNEREIVGEGIVLCRACAGYAYYTTATGTPKSAPSNAPQPSAVD